MKRFVILFSVFIFCVQVFAQTKEHKTTQKDNVKKLSPEIVKNKPVVANGKKTPHRKMIPAVDTLTSGDYMLSIDRVNDNLNDIQDSIKLKFEVVGLGRKIMSVSKDIATIRQNIRDKRSSVNLRDMYLYQNFANELDESNDGIQARLTEIYNRVYRAKHRLKNLMSDSIFRKMYNDSVLRKTYDEKLIRLERKWEKTDTITKINIDSLNSLKVKAADNAVNLANMLNMMDNRLDKVGPQLFGKEVNFLWQSDDANKFANDTTKKSSSILGSERKAIGFYFSRTSGERWFVFLLGILLFVWMFFKWKLIKEIKVKTDTFDFLQLRYLNHHPVLAILVLLLCLMPFFDAYAPTSYIAVEYLLLMLASTVILFRKGYEFRYEWVALVILFVANTLSYLVVEPTNPERLLQVAVHICIIVFSVRYFKKLGSDAPYFKWKKTAAVIGIILTVLGILFNLFGRFSLAGIFGLAGIFAVTQAVVLPIFIESFIEIILVQLQSSRLKQGVDKPFDCSTVAKKIKAPLVIVALILWLIMLTSNLNIYHSLSNSVVDFFTATRTIGSITFELISVLMFFVIIWFAHILQRLLSYLFGEIGSETEVTSTSKGQHSRLLITRLLVLIGGYLLAIAASGLPIDKLTFLLGALGVGIGMGLQNIVNNFVSGIILIFDGSLQIGDEIEISGQSGKVKELGLRTSTLNTPDGADVIIPNGNILSQNIVNWTFSSDQKRVMLEFILTGKELDANLINETINETIKNIPNVISQRNPVILYTRVTPENCAITVKFWSIINKADIVKSDTMLQLSAAFTKKKIGFD